MMLTIFKTLSCEKFLQPFNSHRNPKHSSHPDENRPYSQLNFTIEIRRTMDI